MSTDEALRLCGVCGVRVRQRDHRGAHPQKRCTACGRTLPLRDFDTWNSAADGYRQTCRACVLATGGPRQGRPARRPPTADRPPAGSRAPMSYAEQSTVYMLIGTIVHRAVLWPMVRPMTGSRLDAFEDAGFLVERASTALAVLERSLRPLVGGASEHDRDDALAVLNLEGPWDTRSFGPMWESLGEVARQEVFRGLDRLVENAATAVSNAVRSRGILGDVVTCAWSEVPLFAVDGFFDPGDDDETRLRADLVLWRERGGIDVLDLKVGNTSPPDRIHERHREQVSGYVQEVRRRVPADRSVRGALVYAGRGHRDTRIERV